MLIIYLMAGNTSGGFFSDTYPRNVHCISHGRAITFGRIAGKMRMRRASNRFPPQ